MIIQPKGKQVEVLGIRDRGHFVVLGTAGSGKTTIALLRAINLANLPGNDKVLLVTFNGALVEYMKGIENISRRLTIENYHKFARGYLASRGKMPTFGGIVENEQREKLIDSAVEILKKELLKQDSVESCFNDEYREMMACIAGAVDCSIEKIERFLTDYGRLTRINQMTYVSREHETKEEFYKMPHKKRKGRLL